MRRWFFQKNSGAAGGGGGGGFFMGKNDATQKKNTNITNNENALKVGLKNFFLDKKTNTRTSAKLKNSTGQMFHEMAKYLFISLWIVFLNKSVT